MPTNRRRRTREASLEPALIEWTRTADADRFFRCEYGTDNSDHYHGPASLAAVINARPWLCPAFHIWAAHIEGGDCDGGSRHHDCKALLAQLIDAHKTWSKKR